MHLHNHLKCFICHYESNSTACITTVGFGGLDDCMMSLTCTFFIVDVPSSFSPFVEFKEKTQQWKLLGELLVLFYDFCWSMGWLLSPELYFPACCSPERKTSGAVNSFVMPFLLAEWRCVLPSRFFTRLQYQQQAENKWAKALGFISLCCWANRVYVSLQICLNTFIVSLL